MAEKKKPEAEPVVLTDTELVAQKVAAVRAAQAKFATYTQEQVDYIFYKAAMAADNARIPLARMAVEETGMGILEDKALPSIEIIPKVGFYDYENKYQPGAADEICPAEISPEWEARLAQAALTVFRTLGLSVYSRADFIVTEDGTPWFLEINTLPGMTPTSLLPQEAAAVGISPAELIESIRAYESERAAEKAEASQETDTQ